MSLTRAANEQLAAAGLKLDRFQELITRLLANGIIVRDEDGVEQRLYDDARRIEALLSEYFQLAGFHLHHDVKGEFFRLYAPGAQAPGITPDDVEPVPALRARLSPDFVTAALALRFLYQKGLMDGGKDLTDEGEVLIRFEELVATLHTQLKRPLPDSLVEREKVLRELKRHRLIRVSASFSMADEDALIAIRQTILGIISEDVLAAALDHDDSPAPQDADSQDATP